MRYRHRSLFHQFILLAAVICCIVAVSFCAMLLYVYDYSRRSSFQVLDNLHQQTMARIGEYYTFIENETYILCYSPTLQDYLQADSIDARIDMIDSLKSLHSGAYLALDGLIGIAAFDTEGNLIRSSMENLFGDSLPTELTDIGSTCYLFAPSDSQSLSRNSFASLSPAYVLIPKSRLLGDRIGTVVLTFSTDHLTALVRSSGMSDSAYLILTDPEGNVIAANSGAAADYYQSGLWQSEEPAASIRTTLPESGWQLHSFMPHNFLRAEIKPLVAIISVTSCMFLSMLLLLIHMLRHKILQPISKLSGFMARVPKDKHPVRFQANENNELGTMIYMMNQMLDDLEQKSRQLQESQARAYTMELSRKDMEILAYRNQINPHFLYNTLDCICSMAMYHGVDDIAGISESLSTMFRYAVKGDSFATVQQEIVYVQEYAAIIACRFMGRITVHIDASPETLHLQTIKLLIQPLVENAVFHGLEKRVGAGSVSVQTMVTEGKNLRISVQDDGIGIRSQVLESLQKSILEAQTDAPTAPQAEKSIGLRNIARRIHLYYGSHGLIQVHSTEGTGTNVTITLPLEGGENLCIES